MTPRKVTHTAHIIVLLNGAGLRLHSLLILDKSCYPEHNGKHWKALRREMMGSVQLLGGEQMKGQLERMWEMSCVQTAVGQARSLVPAWFRVKKY